MGSSNFTLTTVFVSIVATGLATIGVAQTVATEESSKIKSVISEVKNLQSSVLAFKTKYEYLPGDLPNAVEILDKKANNGDGNGDLYNESFSDSDDKQYLEGIYLPQHLYLSGIISTEYSGQWGRSDMYLPGINTPDSAYSRDAFYSFANYKSDKYPLFEKPALPNIILGSAKTTDGAGWDSAITPQDAKAIETKIDDGNPSTGDVLTMRGDDLESHRTKCISRGSWDLAGSAEFLPYDTSESCVMAFYYLK
ncbi:MAG: hypothetical protein COV35_07470 [Alphaproteobacteria bacterium CG11_big_fil_rev_8_21_14_0_20_39_49]|nr:MAG: hypothetical protein COV35_07470 [Alphaproteobacteria bacterium CG11_big_fil_rev_8_21_14_0_20_39_49]